MIQIAWTIFSYLIDFSVAPAFAIYNLYPYLFTLIASLHVQVNSTCMYVCKDYRLLISNSDFFQTAHEWLKVDNDGTATMGISDHAQTLLGDVVFVDIPDTDEEVVAGESFMLVESVKAASDIYAPIDGTIIAVNESLEDSPEIVNESPEDEAWMVKIKIEDRSQLDNLMSLEEYLATIESE